MATVGLALKRVFNEVNDHLQNTILPVGAPSTSELPSSPNMPSQVGGGLQSIMRVYLTMGRSFRVLSAMRPRHSSIMQRTPS